jgi:hypothetical protein
MGHSPTTNTGHWLATAVTICWTRFQSPEIQTLQCPILVFSYLTNLYIYPTPTG